MSWHVLFEAINSAFLWKLDIDCFVVMRIFCVFIVFKKGEERGVCCWCYGWKWDHRLLVWTWSWSQTPDTCCHRLPELLLLPWQQDLTGYNGESVRGIFVLEFLWYILWQRSLCFKCRAWRLLFSQGAHVLLSWKMYECIKKKYKIEYMHFNSTPDVLEMFLIYYI